MMAGRLVGWPPAGAAERMELEVVRSGFGYA
jgi:hypothetical protein